MSPEEFVKYLDDLGARIAEDPFHKALDECAEVLQWGFVGNFDRTEDRDGLVWPPHAPATVAKYGPHPLLILSGKMFSAAAGDGVGSVVEVNDRELAVGVSGSEILYAAVHQHGSDRIPKREFIYATEEVLAECESVIGEYLVSLVAGNW